MLFATLSRPLVPRQSLGTRNSYGWCRPLCVFMVGCAVVSLIAAGPPPAEEPLQRITFTDAEGTPRTVEGKILVEAADGGLLVSERDGRLWTVTPQQLKNRELTEATFTPFTADELTQRLQREFGQGFEVVTTPHYVICSNAGPVYTQWCGHLFERLFAAFRKQWRTAELGQDDPELPLTAIVFVNHKQFAEYARAEFGPQFADSKGYYSIRTNRMVLYDLTADDGSPPAESLNDVARKVAQSPFNAATVVHEATHQIAYNCGIHNRYADNPLWLTEGMAMYFETPDLRTRVGWRTVGRVNPFRMTRFRDVLQNRRKDDSLAKLVTSDDRFRNPETAEDAYAEAWALTYFLLKRNRDAYVEYLKRVSAKPRLIWDTPEQRLQEFQAAFGEDLGELERDFLRYMSRLGRR